MRGRRDEVSGEKGIKQYLDDKGISQAYLSRKAQIPPDKLNLSLNGKRKLTLDEYATICGVLGVNTDKFLHPRVPIQGEVKEKK